MNESVVNRKQRGLLDTKAQAMSAALLVVASLVLITTAGCGGEDIRTYDVPQIAKVPDAAKTGGASTATTNTNSSTTGTRLLAAIVPRPQEVWHFKMMGPSAFVSPQADAFIKFAENVKFKPAAPGSEEGSQPSWDLPSGWTQRAGSGMRFATIIVGESAHGLELTVFRFGPESGDIKSNVRRWAGQAGVTDLSDAALADMTRPLIVDDQSATLVDVTGPGSGGDPSMAGPVRPQQPQPPAKPERLAAAAPEGFTADPNPGQFLISKYDITKDGKTASLTVSSAGGAVAANLNRWREQVGLETWDQESILKALNDKNELNEAEINGRGFLIVDLTGPESLGDGREKILGALTPDGSGNERAWFIKFRGPADLVASQKPAFEAFLKSIRFEN